MHDRAFFSARPPVQAVGKRQSKERDVRERTLFHPGESAIRRVVSHPTLTNDPAAFRIGEAYTKEIGQPRTSP